MKKMIKVTALFAVLTVVTSLFGQPKNMIGNQSQNEGILAVPAKGAVKIDGDLSDWDLSGRIWVFADKNVRNRFSAEVATMWDEDALYFAAKWKDPTPMYSMVDPEFNPSYGWKSDSIQMRILSDDQTSWITTWYFAEKQQPVFHSAVWQDRSNNKKGVDEILLIAEPGGTVLGKGVEMAYKMDEDKKGYVQEIKIPWSFFYKDVPKIESGLVFRMGLEFLWGDVTGKTWPVHRYADNMQPGATSREFFWTATRAWGDIKLLNKGDIEVREYVSDDGQIAGTIPIRAEIPKDAARFTLAINDANGIRIRNLAGDCIPEDYSVEVKGDKRVVEVKWDGLDDTGKLVPPGTYSVLGLSHKGIGSEYELCYYNPGTPPWPTAKGDGAWGADHCAPKCIAQAGEWIIASWPFAEGGSGIMGIGPDGLKKWGEKRGAEQLAADDKFVYAIPAGWHIKENYIIRLDKKTGAYKPFELNGKELPFEYPIKDAVKDPKAGNVTGIAVNDKVIAIALNDQATEQVNRPEALEDRNGESESVEAMGMLAFINKETAQLINKVKIPVLEAIAFNSKGNIFGICKGKVFAIDIKTGKLTPLKTPGLGEASAITFDSDDNLVVTDIGQDKQVKAYSLDGKLVYTCGKKGGRPIRGKFDPQAMLKMSSVAVDAKGQVWVVESWDFPRRISVWNPKDGALVIDYIGNTGYAGTGCYLHDDNPELAYVGPIEIKLDRKNKTWSVENILWVPDIDAGESFPLSPGSHAQCQRFTAEINGKTHEYLFVPPYRDYQGYVIFMERKGKWQPVSAITTAGAVSGKFAHHGQVVEEPSGEFAGLNSYDSVIWNDTNKDGKLQRSECEIFPAAVPGTDKKRGEMSIPMGSGWGERIGKDFVFYANKSKDPDAGIYRYAPVGFTKDGAPLYSAKSMQKISDENGRGDMVPLDKDSLLSLSWGNNAYISAIDTATGNFKWKYPNPYPGVHGSHRATMPKPGLLIGPLKIVGVAEVNDEIGKVFVMRGNLGQDFFMTEDGLYVGTMFQDGRVPAEVLPDKEDRLAGMPMESFSHGGEPFNGWFGRQDDGKIRMTTGFPRQAAMVLEVKGLDSISTFKLPDLKVTAQDIIKANEDNLVRQAKLIQPKSYTVKKFDGQWKEIPELTMARKGAPYKGTAKMAYDDKNLYLHYEIEDKSPWMNAGKDYTRLFKTGDAVDLFINVDPEMTKDAKRSNPAAGDVRILVSQLNGKPTAILTMTVDKTASEGKKVIYQSPVMTKSHDRVEIMTDAKIKLDKTSNSYTVEVAVPLKSIGLKPAKGMKLKSDLGFISSDPTGQINTARTYWSNKDTNLLSDLPQESWFNPQSWGELVFE